MLKFGLSCLFFISLTGLCSGQVFTFECKCDYLSPSDTNCDICNTSVLKRHFSGLLIRKNGIPFKWIDEPYTVRQLAGDNVLFIEQIPAPDQITIARFQTQFATTADFLDSTVCQCNQGGTTYIPGPGIQISGDTISALDISSINELQYIDSFYISAGKLYASLFLDSIPASFVTLPVPDGSETIVTSGTGISVTGTGTSGSPYVVTNTAPHVGTNLTYTGTSSPLTLNSSTGTDVTHTAGTGISLSGSSTNMTITNTLPDVTVSIVGAGINVVTGTYPNFTVTGTEVDGSTTNELQTYGHAGTTTYTNTLSGGGGSWSITGAGIAAISQAGGAITVTATEVDGSTTNELQTISVASNTTTLSNSGGSMTIAGAGINVATTSGSTITITGTEVDGSVTNEGLLGVGAGGASSSVLLSNTSGATGVTMNAAGILAISESTSSNGGSITLTATEVDGSTTNELQTIAVTGTTSGTITLSNSGGSATIAGAGINTVGVSGSTITITGTEVDGSVTNEAQTLSASGTTSGIITLSTAGGAGGGTVTVAAGSGIGVAQSGGTITISNTAAAGYVNGGNSFGAVATIGLNDNFRWDFEQNNTVRGGINTNGSWYIGSTSLSTAQLNINTLGSTGTGMLISGGGSLVGPNFYTATGSGTGSTATVLSGVVSMISGNVEALISNTATAGTGGGAVYTAKVSATASTNDAYFHWVSGAVEWSMGPDNDDVDDVKFHRFSRPSDNNGQGTIEFGYRTNDIGMSINKIGIGITTNGFYAIDVGGKVRTDQYVNNALDISAAAFATIALGTAAGTSPTVDNAITSVWGNGAHLKFTSGSSPTANGVICTVTLDPHYTFNDCVSNISARTTNASGLGYSSTYNSATRVITFTLNGTLTASTVYEFNIMFFGRN